MEIASMQRGGSSADTWVLTEGEVDPPACCTTTHPAVDTRTARTVTSRAAENLFWLGRYTERTENAARLARLALKPQWRGPVVAAAAGLAERTGTVATAWCCRRAGAPQARGACSNAR
jgi:hypothetical protein